MKDSSQLKSVFTESICNSFHNSLMQCYYCILSPNTALDPEEKERERETVDKKMKAHR